MRKIVHIVGARPQFIKLAPLVHKSKDIFESVIIHTGQHYDRAMSDCFFDDLDIPNPAYNLNIGSANHGKQTAEMLAGIEDVLLKEKPDAVIVYGDTNTTLAGAMASVKLNIKTAHVEACLRSFNKTMPEEINRICVDHISSVLFVPTEVAMKNAIKEGLKDKAYLTGDIMTDSLAYGLSIVNKRSDILAKLDISKDSYYLLTLHRPYTVDNISLLTELLNKLNCLEHKVLFPIHPRTSNILSSYNIKQLANIRIISPQSYLDFIALMDNSKMILTDSGGIQKEAFILKKLCVTLRTETEWTETVQSGWNTLVNPNQDNLTDIIKSAKTQQAYPDLFGTEVTEKIIRILKEILAV